MKSTQDYTFEVSISYQSFDHKPNRGTEIPKLTFAKQTINVNGFLQYLLAGHCYAPIFSSDEFTMSGKKDCNYRYSYFVSIDIDHTDVEMNAMVDKLAYKPTIAYTSCSNGLGGKFSYRLIYCFENRIEGTKEYYNQVYSILDVNGLSVNDIDKRSLKLSHCATVIFAHLLCTLTGKPTVIFALVSALKPDLVNAPLTEHAGCGIVVMQQSTAQSVNDCLKALLVLFRGVMLASIVALVNDTDAHDGKITVLDCIDKLLRFLFRLDAANLTSRIVAQNLAKSA